MIYNPVKINFGSGISETIGEATGNRRVAVVTSKSWPKRSEFQNAIKDLNTVAVISDVKPNPTFKDLNIIWNRINNYSFDLLLAFGGGSALDTAKVVSVVTRRGGFSEIESLIKNGNKDIPYSLIPIIGVPTTAGTGSEVTPWATVWNMEERIKYSLHLKDLFFESVFCDPNLLIHTPKELAITCALDALSHAIESVWGGKGTESSIDLAYQAIEKIHGVLCVWQKEYRPDKTAEDAMRGSLLAGLAFSQTQTSIAHAISYYLTLHHNIPHGIACGFSLPTILEEFNVLNPKISLKMNDILNNNSRESLSSLFVRLGIPTRLRDFGLATTEKKAILNDTLRYPQAQNSVFNVEKLIDNLF